MSRYRSNVDTQELHREASNLIKAIPLSSLSPHVQELIIDTATYDKEHEDEFELAFAVMLGLPLSLLVPYRNQFFNALIEKDFWTPYQIPLNGKKNSLYI